MCLLVLRYVMHSLGVRSLVAAYAEPVQMFRCVLHPEDGDCNARRNFGILST
jgi:hypothetical protein